MPVVLFSLCFSSMQLLNIVIAYFYVTWSGLKGQFATQNTGNRQCLAISDNGNRQGEVCIHLFM